MSRRCGVVVAHASLAEGFLAALERVAGRQDNLWGVSNEGKSTDALLDEIRGRLEGGGDRKAVLFSDMDGGSCGQASRRLLADGTVKAVFYGVNLPLLFEFVFLQDQPFDTMVAAMISKSRSALGVHS